MTLFRVRAFAIKTIKHIVMKEITGGAGEIRTPDLWFRKPALYPSELQPRFSSFYNEKQVSESSFQIIPFHRLDHLIETREVAESSRYISYNHLSKELHVTATVLLECLAARSEVV